MQNGYILLLSYLKNLCAFACPVGPEDLTGAGLRENSCKRYSPLKLGLRFSKNAACPSRMSALERALLKIVWASLD